MSSTASVFALNNHCSHYGDQQVLENISLTICQGEKVALLGPSGAGKSTLLEVLYQQQPAISALQPQGGGLVDILSVYHNIFMGALDRVGTLPSLWNLVRPLASHRTAILELCRLLGIEEKLWQSIDRLSGGQKQRVAIGRALYRQQPVFLGDEPVSSIDPIQARVLLQHVLASHETAVVSLHNRRLALDHFDRIILLQQGRIVCDCPVSEMSAERLDELYQADESPLQDSSSGTGSGADGWVIRTS